MHFYFKVCKLETCRGPKCTYYINFGIAPYFKDLLLEEIKSAKFIVVSYDETLNTILKKEQIDILVRFLNENLELQSCAKYIGNLLGFTENLDLK